MSNIWNYNKTQKLFNISTACIFLGYNKTTKIVIGYNALNKKPHRSTA